MGARVLMELRPDRNLLDPKFEGYKLCLEPIPIRQVSLKTRPDVVFPSSNQYSFLHTKLFVSHNKLFRDPWHENNIYFIDEKWNIFVQRENSVTPEGCSLSEVWKVPSYERQAGHYNISLSFASPDVVVIGNGTGTLHVVITGDRSFDWKWEAAYSYEPIGIGNGFLIIDSRFYCDELHCLLLNVREETEEEAQDHVNSRQKNSCKPRFISVIDWITLGGEDDSWKTHAVRQLIASGSVHYAALEQSCSAIYIACDGQVKFVTDSENPMQVIDQQLKDNVPEEIKPQIIFSWLQTADKVTLWLPLANNASKSDIKVTITPLSLEVVVYGNVLLEGLLSRRVDVELCTWIFNPEKLEIILSKDEPGVGWQEAIVGSNQGEEILDATFVEEVHQRLAHLCSENVESETNGPALSYNSQPLEDCDAFPLDSAVLLRLESRSHRISHQLNLSGHQWLLNTRLRPDTPPAICLRHDVDACVWQMKELDRETDTWSPTHVGTFLAFGYVQASKQQRIFTVCAPDLSYVAVCDMSRHLYIYHQSGTAGSELRNRATGQRVAQIAKQQILQLETSEHVLGCQATNRCVFLLTESSFYKVSIK